MYNRERDYLSFPRIMVPMFGPETDQLILNDSIFTQSRRDITTANFPLGSDLYADLIVLVPIEKNWDKTIEEALNGLRLSLPKTRHAIRLVSLFRANDKHSVLIEKNIFFPHIPPYVSQWIKTPQIPNDPQWLVSAWRKDLKRPELCLWSCQRNWGGNKKDMIAGVATHLRITRDEYERRIGKSSPSLNLR